MGIVFAVMVPLLIVVNVLVAAILLPVFFLIILGSYIIGIGSLRDGIRLEKNAQLEKINIKLSSIAKSLIDYDEKEGNIDHLQNLNERFKILEEMGNRIQNIRESPRSISAFIKIGSSSMLPLLSFVSIDQIALFI